MPYLNRKIKIRLLLKFYVTYMVEFLLKIIRNYYEEKLTKAHKKLSRAENFKFSLHVPGIFEYLLTFGKLSKSAISEAITFFKHKFEAFKLIAPKIYDRRAINK